MTRAAWARMSFVLLWPTLKGQVEMRPVRVRDGCKRCSLEKKRTCAVGAGGLAVVMGVASMLFLETTNSREILYVCTVSGGSANP